MGVGAHYFALGVIGRAIHVNRPENKWKLKAMESEQIVALGVESVGSTTLNLYLAKRELHCTALDGFFPSAAFQTSDSPY